MAAKIESLGKPGNGKRAETAKNRAEPTERRAEADAHAGHLPMFCRALGFDCGEKGEVTQKSREAQKGSPAASVGDHADFTGSMFLGAEKG